MVRMRESGCGDRVGECTRVRVMCAKIFFYLPRGRYGIHAQRLSHDRRPCRKPVCGFTREPVYSPHIDAAFTRRDPILLSCPQLKSPRGSWKTRLLPSPFTSSHHLPPPSISFSRP